MTKKEISKASKLYAMFNDSAASDNEKETAKNRLFDLLKKHKAALSDFVADLSDDNAKLFDFSEKQSEVKRNYKLADNTLKASNNKKSRRKLIIEMLKTNNFTKREIASVLTEKHDIADFKNNMKAVSGTIYDLQSHNVADFKIDNESEKVISTFA